MQTKQQKISESIKKVKEAYDTFLDDVGRAQKEHREKINEIVSRIEARKIEKLRGEIKSS